MKKLQSDICEFTQARGWDGNRDARSLAISISLEASELLEHYQWLSPEEAHAKNKEAIAEEAADVFIYLLQFADVLGIDLEQIAREKLAKNALRFPI